VKEPKGKLTWGDLTWTGLGVGAPCLEAFGMNKGEGAPAALQGRELQEAAWVLLFKWVAFASPLVAVR